MSPLPKSHRRCSPTCPAPLGCDPEKMAFYIFVIFVWWYSWYLYLHRHILFVQHLLAVVLKQWECQAIKLGSEQWLICGMWFCFMMICVMWCAFSQFVYCEDYRVIYAPWIFRLDLWGLPSRSDGTAAETKLWVNLARAGNRQQPISAMGILALLP